MNTFGKVFAGLVSGLVFGVLLYFLINMAFANYATMDSEPNTIWLGVGFVAMGLTAFFADRPAQSWRRGLIGTALLLLMVPVFGFFMTSGLTAAGSDGFEAAGGAVAGGLVTGAASLFAFVLAVPMMVVGLLVGRKPTVVVVASEPTG